VRAPELPLEEAMREADLPAEQPEAQEEARVPHPYAYARRPRGAEGAPRPRPRAPVGLILRLRDRGTLALLARARACRRGPVWVRRVAITGPGPQVGYAVGRRVGNAVTRNRVRRRLRAAVHQVGEHVRSDSAYLVGTTPAAAHASFAELRDALGRCLQDAA
jgi:ribonuclease P protein component